MAAIDEMVRMATSRADGLCCFSLFAAETLYSNLGGAALQNVFSTYKVGSYLFVARYGGNFNNTTPVYVGNMTVSENQTPEISGYRDSAGDVPPAA